MAATLSKKITRQPNLDQVMLCGLVNKTTGYKTIRIELAKNIAVLVALLGKHFPEYYRHLEKIKTYPIKYLLCAFPIGQLMAYTDEVYIGKMLFERLEKVEQYYQLKVLFCESISAANDRCLDILIENII